RRLELEVLEARCVPTAGLLDPSFGVGGEVLTNAANFYYEQVAVLPDGGVIKAGSTSDMTHFEVARFKADGSPFTAFGSGGVAVIGTVALSPSWSAGVSLALWSNPTDLNDVRIVLAGTTSFDFVVVRLTLD